MAIVANSEKRVILRYNDTMQIRTLNANELSLLFHYTDLEGWDNEEIHTTALYKAHSDDFFIAFENEELIGFIMALRYSDKFGFISSFLILKEFRGMGYGKKLFSFALEHLDGYQIALDSLPDKQELYKQFGFKSYADVINYKFIKGSVTLPSSEIKVENFNKEYSLIGHNIYMQEMITHKDTQYKAIVQEKKVSSFALMFPYIDGYKIFIDSQDINEAITLFFALSDSLSDKTPIYMQASSLSPLLEAISELLLMSEYSKFVRMYNKILD